MRVPENCTCTSKKLRCILAICPEEAQWTDFKKNQNRLFGMAAMHAGFTQLQ